MIALVSCRCHCHGCGDTASGRTTIHVGRRPQGCPPKPSSPRPPLWHGAVGFWARPPEVPKGPGREREAGPVPCTAAASAGTEPQSRREPELVLQQHWGWRNGKGPGEGYRKGCRKRAHLGQKRIFPISVSQPGAAPTDRLQAAIPRCRAEPRSTQTHQVAREGFTELHPRSPWVLPTCPTRAGTQHPAQQSRPHHVLRPQRVPQRQAPNPASMGCPDRSTPNPNILRPRMLFAWHQATPPQPRSPRTPAYLGVCASSTRCPSWNS